MTIDKCMDEFIMYVSSYGADDTVVYYTHNLMFFRFYLVHIGRNANDDISSLKKDDFVGYIAYHKNRGVKNVSVRTYARAIKVFLRYCYHEHYFDEDITQGVKYPKSDKKIVEPLSAKRVQALIEHIEKKTLYRRDLVIFHLMLDCGLRRSEVVNLDVDDVHFTDGYITIVDSKNGVSRIVPLPERVKVLIEDYMRTTYHVNNSALILDRFKKERITKSAINKMFVRLKCVDKSIHPHLLRHTFGSSFILGGGSLEILRVLMGHSDYSTTKEYLHVASQSKIVGLDIYKLDDIYFRVYNYNKE